MYRFLTALCTLALLASVPGPAHGHTAPATSEVFVVSTLYTRHETTPAYGLDTLQALISRIDAQVLVLDVTPSELDAREPHGGKIEYREVVFPMLDERDYRVYAAEPAEPLFSEIVEPFAARRVALGRDDPAAMEAWRAYESATNALLARLWTDPATVNGALTDRVMHTRQRLESAVFGPDDDTDWNRWNGHIAEVVTRAVAENPGQRVLVLVGVSNRYWLIDALREAPGVTLVDVEAWLAR